MVAGYSKQDDPSKLFDDVGPAEGEAASGSSREDRAQVALEVSFPSPAEAVRAYSENVGVGQIAILTNSPVRKGTEFTVRVRVPGWEPLQTVGKVTWSRKDAMGIAFMGMKPAHQERLRKLVLENTSMLDRMRRQFSRQDEEPIQATVAIRQTVLVKLQDELLSDVVVEALNQGGFFAASDTSSGSRPTALVAELATIGPLLPVYKLLPLVLVNANGPNDLAYARMPTLRVRAFAGRPASAPKILQALNQIFYQR